MRIHDGKQDKNLAEFFKQSFSFGKLHKFYQKNCNIIEIRITIKYSNVEIR